MGVKVTQAQQLLDNPLLEELCNEYIGRCFASWLNKMTIDEQRDERAKARAAVDVQQYIQNKCQELINGHQ